MPGPVQITYTIGLLEKLSGVDVKKKQAAPKQLSAASGPPQAVIHPEMLALRRQDAQLARAVHDSKRVGNFLLKHEEEETKKIQALAEDLLKQYRVQPSPVPCQEQRRDCVECYKQHPEDPLKCGPLVDAYSRCAESVFNSSMRNA